MGPALRRAPAPRAHACRPSDQLPAWLGKGRIGTALNALRALESGREPATARSPPGLRPGMGPIPIELACL